MSDSTGIFIDGLPPAPSVTLADLVIVAQGGNGTPGTAVTRYATLSEVLANVSAEGVTVTDGVQSVSGALTLAFTGAVVSGSGGNAIITISGGSGSSLTVTDGTHFLPNITGLGFSGASVVSSGGGGATVVYPTPPGLTVTDGTTSLPNTLTLDFAGSTVTGSGNAVTVNYAGAGLTLTDGSHSVDNTTSINFVGSTVAGSAGSAVINFPNINQQLTGKFFQSNGANMNRLADRVFVGAAVINDGLFPNVTKDWLSNIVDPTGTLGEPTTAVAQLASLSTFGGTGVLGASQSSDNTIPNSLGCIGVTAFAMNNNPTLVQTSYGAYIEGRAMAGLHAGSITIGLEVDNGNQSGVVIPVNPYLPYIPGATYGIFSVAGAGLTSVQDASLGLLIGNNGAKWRTGLLFAANGIVGTDGHTGGGVAIAMAAGHVIQWYTPNGSLASSITSTMVSNTPTPIQMQFLDAGLKFYNPNGLGLFGLNPVPPTAFATAVFMLVNNNSGVNEVNVTIGAADSGGAGFRVLKVPN